MQQRARRVVLSWCEEIFADLLATSLVGPSYAIAFDRLVRLTVAHSDVHMRFSDIHPANHFRRTQIAQFLDEQGWFAAIDRADTARANVDFVADMNTLRTTGEVPEYKFPLDNSALAKVFVEAFISLVPRVVSAVKSITVHLPRQIDDFLRYYGEITESLFHLVVPNVVYDPKSHSISPSPVTTLICGSLVLNQDLDSVFALCGRDMNNIEDRLWVENRINRLVMKAMEDAMVLEKWWQV